MKFKYSGCLPQNCPNILNDEVVGSATYYRIVDMFPPKKKCFIPHYYIQEKREMLETRKKKPTQSQLCKLFSVSVFQNIDDFIKMTETNLKLKEKYVAEGIIVAGKDGVIKTTPSTMYPSHYDWFPFSGIMETHIFSKVVNL